MPNSLTGRNLDLTPKVRSYVERKVERLRKVFENIQKIDVILSEMKRHGEADLVVQAAQGTLKCAAKDATPMAAFDIAMDKMERQLARHKARIKGNKKHLRETTRKPETLEGETDSEADAGEEEETGIPEAQPVRPRRMSPAEALDSFVRSSFELLVYIDEEIERPAVLYRDEDGESRLIHVLEPE